MINNLKRFDESMPKTLYISKGLINPIGGAEVAAFQILKGILLSDKLEKVIILTTKPSNFQKRPVKRDLSKLSIYKRFCFNKVRFYYIPLMKPRIPIISDYFDARRFKLALKKIMSLEKIDLIHIHTYSAFYITPNPDWDIPILYTFHDFPIKWPNKPFNFFPFNYIEKIWKYMAEIYWRIILSEEKLNNCDLYFHCLSSEIRNFLLQKGLSINKIRLLPNGYVKFEKEEETKSEIFLKRINKFFNSQSNKKLKILTVGILNNTKNQFIILKGFEEFSESVSDSILLIAGSPTPIIGTFYLRKIWKFLKPQTKKRIFWLGHITNKNLLTAVYRFADIIVTMSHSEACPLILGECKTMKKPIISSNVGALKDLLPEELKGLNPNSPKSLRVKLEEISYNEQTLEKYKEMIKTIPILSWDEIGEELSEFYQLILNPKK